MSTTPMLQKGTPVYWLQKEMGHRNLTMVLRYYWRWINLGDSIAPLFYYTSKNRMRRWCSATECGTSNERGQVLLSEPKP